MTPEFYNCLFNWIYEEAVDGPEQCCIPLQLQLLFGRMKLGEAAIVDTKALTTSFGWRDVDSVCYQS
jgi:predicted enzyme related to lactoylglutathione lyase